MARSAMSLYHTCQQPKLLLAPQVIGSDVRLSDIRSAFTKLECLRLEAMLEHTSSLYLQAVGLWWMCCGSGSHDFIPIAEGLLPASSGSAWTFQSFLNWSRLRRRVFV